MESDEAITCHTSEMTPLYLYSFLYHLYLYVVHRKGKYVVTTQQWNATGIMLILQTAANNKIKGQTSDPTRCKNRLFEREEIFTSAKQ